VAAAGDSTILLEFDPQMRSRIWHLPAGRPAAGQVALTRWAASEYLLLGDGRRVEHFTLQRQGADAVTGVHGPGKRLHMTGVSSTGIEKNVEIQLFECFRGSRSTVSRTATDRPAPSCCALGQRRPSPAGRCCRARRTAGPHFWSYCGACTRPTRLGATGGAGIRAGTTSWE
jgi:hypothetical protein